MDFRTEAVSLGENYRARLNNIRTRTLEEVKKILHEDIEDPVKTGPGSDREWYLHRVNQIGIGTLNSGLYSLGLEIYKMLILEVRSYRETTGNWRHMGTLYANLAAAHFVLGDTDQGVFVLLQAADEDYRTAQVPPQNTNAISVMLKEYFIRPVLQYALLRVQRIESSVQYSELENLLQILGDRSYVFLVYIFAFRKNAANQSVLLSEFNYWQMFSALRNLSTVFEVEIKSLANHQSLSKSIDILYSTQAWWSNYLQAKAAVGESQNSLVPSEVRLSQALQITATTSDEKFWRSLLVSLITRNYTVHQMDSANILSVSSLEEILCCILYAIMRAPYTR